MRARITDNWVKAGKPLPPPREYKHEVILYFAKRFGLRTFVETGTYVGGTLMAVLHAFEQCFSVDANRDYYLDALKRFADCQNVILAHGNSSEYLPAMLTAIKEPCLFWLDAHTNNASPILEEIRIIAGHPVKKHVIFVDDVRLMGSAVFWPKLKQVEALVHEHWPRHAMEVVDDILRIYP